MSLEIERKFMLPEFPQAQIASGELIQKSAQRIEQTYLAIDENQELRVRRISNLTTGEVSYTHTFKLGNGLSREEIEYEISESIYTQVTQAFQSVPLTKNRYTLQWQGYVIELDVYDQLQLSVAEVEFVSMEEAERFEPPAWFGPDISFEKQYSNKTVWRELQKRGQ